MANPEHLEILKQGVEVWNRWRKEHREIIPDLRGANFSGVYLEGVDLLSASLIGANFSGADLFNADLRGAFLVSADFSNANLSFVSLISADLKLADFTGVTLNYTSFGGNDLSRVKGLETAIHQGPSPIDTETLYKSGGNIPETFLRGCGVPEVFITYLRSLVTRPVQFYSCFISYSSKDQDFANRLHVDLQSMGVRCWFAPEDLKIGDRIRDSIDESIRLRDKLLLVLSESSIASDWVEHEVESALEEERHRGRAILFPIRLDDAAMESNKAWASLVRRTRHIGDFTGWKHHDQYQKAFARLLRDLKAEDGQAAEA